jgi:hypothetical protein
MSNLAGYLIGVLLVIVGLGYAAYRAGINTTWIVVGAVVVAGLGIMAGIARTRRPETPPNG